MTTKKHAHDDMTEATEATETPAAPSADPLPAWSEDAYWTRRRELEAALVALEIQRSSSVRYPAWRYHATEPPLIVASESAAEALGAGWQETPVATEPPAAPAAEASGAHWDLPGR